MEIPQIPTIEDVRSMLYLIGNDDIIGVVFEGDTERFLSFDKKQRSESVTRFVDMTTFVHRYLNFNSYGKGYRQENKPLKISDMFCHAVWSDYCLFEALETLLKKNKRDKKYVDKFMQQFAYDMKNIYNFCVSVSNGELPDSIKLYNNKKIKTYTAVQDGLFGTKIQVTE